MTQAFDDADIYNLTKKKKKKTSQLTNQPTKSGESNVEKVLTSTP